MSASNPDPGRQSALNRLRKAASLGFGPMAPQSSQTVSIEPPRLPSPESLRGPMRRSTPDFRLLRDDDAADDFDFCGALAAGKKQTKRPPPVALSQKTSGSQALQFQTVSLAAPRAALTDEIFRGEAPPPLGIEPPPAPDADGRDRQAQRRRSADDDKRGDDEDAEERAKRRELRKLREEWRRKRKEEKQREEQAAAEKERERERERERQREEEQARENDREDSDDSSAPLPRRDRERDKERDRDAKNRHRDRSASEEAPPPRRRGKDGRSPDRDDPKARAELWKQLNNDGRIVPKNLGQVSDRDLDKRLEKEEAERDRPLMSEEEVKVKVKAKKSRASDGGRDESRRNGGREEGRRRSPSRSRSLVQERRRRR